MKHKRHDNNSVIIASLVAGGLLGLGIYYLSSNSKKKNWAKDYYDQGEEIYEQAKGKLYSVSQNFPSNGLNVAVGSIAGAIIGVAAVHLLTSNSKAAAPLLREVTHKAEKWMSKAKDILEQVDESINNEEEEEGSRSTLDDVLHLATVGFKLYNNIKERR